MPSMKVAAAKVAAAEHPGLCGVYHAHIIAVVKSQDVLARSGSTAANKYRNQVSLLLEVVVLGRVRCCCELLYIDAVV
ncbi:unnamed protein product [Ectocarpus sp. CCAP 1310/34]|nr:unnamed protein product [Ectocarpus sp. CCAP 1310/34]